MPNYNQPNPNPRRHHDDDDDEKGIPMWVIVTLFFVSWPLALGLLALRSLLNGTFPFGNRSRFDATPLRSPLRPTPISSLHPDAQPANDTAASSPAEKRNTAPKASETGGRRVGKVQEIMAIVGIVFGICLCVSGAMNLAEIIEWMLMGIYEISFDLMPTLEALFSIVAGGALTGSCLRLRNRIHLRRTLKKVLGSQKHISLRELSEILSCDEKTATKVAEAAAKAGDLGPHAYVDHRADMLVVEGSAPAPVQEQKKPQDNVPQASQSQYQTILMQLRAVNDAIPGEEMTAKISRLEDISAKIFDLAEKDPDKLPQLRKFLNYYLPTSLKLLTTYAQLDAQGVEGDNISQSKRQIENTMDTLCDAFANQLDKLFTSDAIDVSTDIAAMQAMLQQDGLALGDMPTLEL